MIQCPGCHFRAEEFELDGGKVVKMGWSVYRKGCRYVCRDNTFVQVGDYDTSKYPKIKE